MSAATSADIVIIGGGVIGLSVARRAAHDGHSVVVCDPEPGRGASWAAAGMLTASAEARWGEGALHQLLVASAASWPDFAAELEDESGSAVGLREDGTLSVAFDADDWRTLSEAVAVQRQFGCQAELLSSRECRQMEPSLSPRVTNGVFYAGDHQVDNRALVQALTVAVQRCGAKLCPSRVRQVRSGRGVVDGVVLEDGSALAAGQVVLAAGCRSNAIEGLPPADVPPVRPVKGQIMRLRSDPERPLLARTVRALVQGRDVYMVPRTGGEVVVGGTVEEAGFDTTVTVGAVSDLLRAATAAVPDIAELEFGEAIARLRPGSPDNGPLLGPATTPGLVVATGHYRHGILLTPVTAAAMSEALAGRAVTGPAAAFSPQRFAGQPAHG